MECSKVVYWPRHLWASPSVITSGLSVRCVRLSKTALCVVSLDSDPPFDFELLPAKCTESCRVVLFDAHVAALGNFEKFHSPKLLLQIGDFFRHNEEQQPMASIASDGMDTKLLEAVGYYSLYLPMTALGNATTAFQNILSEFWILSWLCASGETLEELSPFLAVISWQLNNAIGLPDRIRYFNRLAKTRRLTQQERLQVLQHFNWICYVMLDMVLGRVVLAYVGDITAPHIQVINTYGYFKQDVFLSLTYASF
ncbi:hypothetical protein CCR75_006686 [Bremia lactucae]|uniref:Uncharacterized protein n=1 Tax=Bremia lactucae TaxID=4779 RepID=A0A976IHA1_BRELC|nr:hypothetical protein CCR75_006686 [Bremia lactucae]